ncbi:MAG: alpha/beta fold hydrolase [Litorimonas sp.]
MAAADVLNGLYEAIADNTRFETMFKAMDDFLDADPVDLELKGADWKNVFRTHFSRVSHYMENDTENGLESPIVHVDRQLVPAAVLNRSLDIVASNSMFDSLNASGQTNIAETISTPKGRRELEKLFVDNGDPEQILLSLLVDGEARPVFIVAKRENLCHVSGQSGAYVSIRAAKAVWNDDMAPLLETAYDLTSAEVEVVRGLIETGSVEKVSRLRKRSVRTVRTQLTNVFAKLGLSTQTELTLFLATLTQMIGKDRRAAGGDTDDASMVPDGTTMKTVNADGQVVSYLTYGSPEGRPVLMIQPSVPPSQTRDLRDIFVRKGLRMIVPFKPGSGATDARSPEHGPEQLAKDYLAILNQENVKSVTVAGQASGGLYALEFAARYRDRVEGVVLVDTGVPFKGRKELMKLPSTARRTFLPARYIPDILLVPHKIIASNFRRSLAGEARVVDYFFADSDADTRLVRTDRRYYDITKRIIAYSFEDIGRLVADVCRWAQDWSHLFIRLSDLPIVFLHGSANTLFSLERVTDVARRNENMSVVSVEGEGQLQLYRQPEMFVTAVEAISCRS